MHSFQFADLPTNDDEYVTMSSQWSNSVDPSQDALWAVIDPVLTAISPHSTSYQQHSKHLSHLHQNTTAYENVIYSYDTSYGLRSAEDDTNDRFNFQSGYNISPNGYETPRYMSPSGMFGGNLSDSSSCSDYTFSPHLTDISPSHSTTPAHSHHGHYHSISSESIPIQHIPWQAETTISYGLHSPFTDTTSECRIRTPVCGTMKDIQFQLPTELATEVMALEDSDPVKVQESLLISGPEELDLSESVSSMLSLDRRLSRQNDKIKTEVLDLNEIEVEQDDEQESLPPDNDSDSDYQARPRRALASTRTYSMSSRATTKPFRAVLDPQVRVQKSPRHNTKYQTQRRGSQSSTRRNALKTEKNFPCTFHHFNCDAVFPNKNEWKRHVASQHLQLGVYRCDLGTCHPENYTGAGRRQHKHADDLPIYNDFNRKDLFTQHCRRMHGPGKTQKYVSKEDTQAFEDQLESIRQRCWQFRRKAPARSFCGFCPAVFEADSASTEKGDGEERAWEERMEHIGRHYERDEVTAKNEAIDANLVEWGIKHKVLKKTNGTVCLSAPAPIRTGKSRTAVEEVARSPVTTRTRRGMRSGTATKILNVIVAKPKSTDGTDEEDDAEAEDE